MKYKVESKCGRKKEIDAVNEQELNSQIVEEFDFKIKEIDNDFDESIYYQKHSRYNGWKIGNSRTSMQQYGCALMCWSYIVRKDPKDIDLLFIKEKVYNNNGQGDSIIFERAAKVLGLDDYYKTFQINTMPKQEETIKEVHLGKSQHFVVRFNKDGKRSIFDPWTGMHQTINFYKFISYRIFNK